MSAFMIAAFAFVVLVLASLGYTAWRKGHFASLGGSAPYFMRAIVSLAVLGAGLYVILDQSYTAEDKKWGYGIVGTMVGYWLKGATN